MLTKSRLMYVDLTVRDLAASRRFYEDVLGLRPLDPDAGSVSYPLGHVLLSLRRTYDPALLPGEQDRSLTFALLVDDVPAARAAMQERAGRLRSTQESPAGTMADFYDPDGYWFSLYQPSDAALTWPSAQKIRALRQVAGELELLYVFLYVRDLAETEKFYQGALGLTPVETNTCHRGMTNLPDGVVKYDAGSVLLTTHHVGEGKHAELHKVTTQAATGLALGFHTGDLEASTEDLAARGLTFDDAEPVASRIGATATFTDPGGHRYYLCQPSAQTMAGAGGAAIRRILGANL